LCNVQTSCRMAHVRRQTLTEGERLWLHARARVHARWSNHLPALSCHQCGHRQDCTQKCRREDRPGSCVDDVGLCGGCSWRRRLLSHLHGHPKVARDLLLHACYRSRVEHRSGDLAGRRRHRGDHLHAQRWSCRCELRRCDRRASRRRDFGGHLSFVRGPVLDGRHSRRIGSVDGCVDPRAAQAPAQQPPDV